jgi:predicted O-methyltransferase YrrM
MNHHILVGRELSGDRLDHHDVCRGGYVAVVFSGDEETIGEWANELTAGIPFKYAMRDPRELPSDFASRSGQWLKEWRWERVGAVDGVCFVLSDGEHPAIDEIESRGGVEGEHFVVIERMRLGGDEEEQRLRLSEVVEAIGEVETITLLGYGDQGQRLRRILCDDMGVASERVLVHDAGEDSRARARADGHALISSDQVLRADGAVIATPMLRVERFAAMLSAASDAGRLVFDNSSVRRSSKPMFTPTGKVWSDAAAARTIEVHGTAIRPGGHGLAIEVNVMRQDVRMMGKSEVVHLHGPQRMWMGPGVMGADLGERWPMDRWGDATFERMERVFVGISDGPALGVFAARELAMDVWPESTRRAFPTEDPGSMGSTVLERVLRRHIDRAEIAMASQSSAQQAMLGLVAAAHGTGMDIVEIGSALGGSSLLMAAATAGSDGRIVSIDPATGSRDIMRYTFGREGFLPRLRQLVMTSDEAIAVLRNEGCVADVVFIDGLHTFDATVSDIQNYAGLVRPGGALMVHDVEPARHGVLRAVMERLVPDPRFAMKCLVDGLAVFERKAGA